MVRGMGLGIGQPRMVAAAATQYFFSIPIFNIPPTCLAPRQQDSGCQQALTPWQEDCYEVPTCAQLPPCRFYNPCSHQLLSQLKMQISRLYLKDIDLVRGGAHEGTFTKHQGAGNAGGLGATLSMNLD